MKLVQLIEAKKVSAKEQALRTIFTPQNIAQHYEAVMGYLGKMSSQDFDDLTTRHSQTDMSQDEIDFQLSMMLKALPKEIDAVVDTGYPTRARGKRMNTVSWPQTPYDSQSHQGEIFYYRGMWYVDARWYKKNGWEIEIVEGKVKTPTEALALALPGLKEVAARIAAKKSKK